MLNTDYQILKVIIRNHKSARLKQIQEIYLELNNIKIPLSTLNSCLERLEKKKYVKWVRYKPPMLTDEVTQLAKELLRHAQLLEVFLCNELGLSAEEGHKESEKLNLLLSCKTVQRICEKYNHPSTSPCGETILNSRICSCAEAIEKKD